MPSQSDNSVSPKIGKLLDLLNASEGQDDQAVQDVAATERLLSGDEGAQDPFDPQAARLAELAAAMRATDKHVPTGEVEQGVRDDEVPQPTTLDETLPPVVENPETRYAAHIVHGMRKIKKDQAD